MKPALLESADGDDADFLRACKKIRLPMPPQSLEHDLVAVELAASGQVV